MEERRRRLVEDLNDAIEGELRIDRVAVSAYATDASLYEIEPLAVAFPRHSRDVEILAAYSADNNIPLIARGAGIRAGRWSDRQWDRDRFFPSHESNRVDHGGPCSSPARRCP